MDFKIINAISLDDIEKIKYHYNNGFKSLEKIGEGSIGAVYKYKNYAIKYGEFLYDGKILEKFQDNPIFLKLYAYNEKIMITEFIEVKEEDIYNYFEKNVDINFNSYDIYKYCFNKGYIPFDIHSENVVVSKNDELKIIDVGSFIDRSDYELELKLEYFINVECRYDYTELDSILNHVKKPKIAI